MRFSNGAATVAFLIVAALSISALASAGFVGWMMKTKGTAAFSRRRIRSKLSSTCMCPRVNTFLEYLWKIPGHPLDAGPADDTLIFSGAENEDTKREA